VADLQAGRRHSSHKTNGFHAELRGPVFVLQRSVWAGFSPLDFLPSTPATRGIMHDFAMWTKRSESLSGDGLIWLES
jgi:hypothetical protein